MPRTTVPITEAGTQYGEEQTNLSFTTVATGDGGQFVHTGFETIVIQGTTGSSVTIAANGLASAKGRTNPSDALGEITTRFGIFPEECLPTRVFRQADGYAYIDVSAGSVGICVLRRP